jgi:hypothetical protein
LINALPGGRNHPGSSANTIANYFAALLRETPSLTGADIATAAGRFASAKSLANMSVPQILSTFGVAAQTGGSPAVIIRGITQLLGQSLLHPTRPASLNTYAAAGLPTDPNSLAKLGGQRVLEALINYVAPNGLNLSKEQRGRLATANKTTLSGLVGGQINLDAIYNAFSRQESVRQFVNLIANGGVPALRAFNKSLETANKNQIAQQMASARLRQSLLVRMQTASTNAGIALLAGADWPLENLVARPAIFASNEAIKHPLATKIGVSTALGLGAANALRRFGAFGRVGKLLGLAGGIETAAVGQAISKEELPNAITGGATDGTRANPFWVIISPLSWSVGQPGGALGGTGGDGTPAVLAKGGRFGLAARVFGSAAAAFVLGKGGYDYFSNPAAAPKSGHGWAWALSHPVGDVNETLADLFGRGNRSISFGVLSKLKGLDPAHQSAALKAIQAAGLQNANISRVVFEGNPKADLTIKFVDKDGKTLTVQEHKGVPIIPKAKTFPSAQGKAGSRKGST